MICAKARDWRIECTARSCASLLIAALSAAGGSRTSVSGLAGAAASEAADSCPSMPALGAGAAASGSALVLERNSIHLSLSTDRQQMGPSMDSQQPRQML